MYFFNEITNFFFLGTILSFIFSILILFTIKFHQSFSLDQNFGIQKVHSGKIPRIGGLSVFFALVIIGLLAKPNLAEKIQIFLLCITPVFLLGIAEDITARIKPKWRLAASFFTSMLLFSYADIAIKETVHEPVSKNDAHGATD